MTTVTDLVTALRNAEITADTEEAKIGRLPAVWVRRTGLRSGTLSGEWIPVIQLRLLVDDNGVDRSAAALLDLFAKVEAAKISPDSDPAFATVVRPSTGNPVPALVFQLDLLP